MVVIDNITPDSIGAELELEPGDILLSVNGVLVEDCIDARFLLADENVLLEVQKLAGDIWDLDIEKDLDDDLGLSFEHPSPKSCGNKCVFCFVHQLPKGLRPSLYVMDEDYRFSFLYGSYVTLSNLTEAELQRIIRQQLSPLYVSVHTTNPTLRDSMLRRDVEPVLPVIQRLLDGGIKLHAQVVVCPEWNDNDELQRTVEELFAAGEGILSLALVPVGLTGHRGHLPQLRVPTSDEAAAVLDALQGWQQDFLARRGSRWVFAADEWYLRAGRNFPADVEYEDYPQLENGIGLIVDFRKRAARTLSKIRTRIDIAVTTVSGQSFATELSQHLQQLEAVSGVRVSLKKIENRLFGGGVTVSGLTAGRDIIEQLKGNQLGEALLIPDIMLKDDSELMLDDVSLTQIATELNVRVVPVRSNLSGLWQGIRRVAMSDHSSRGNEYETQREPTY